MILPFLLALLAFVTLLPIVAPLLRGARPGPTRASFDQAVYRDQLRELDRDIARNLVTPTEADAARLEIQRRLLAADKVPAAPPRVSQSPVLASIVFAVIAVGSVSSYLYLGAPGLPDEPFPASDAQMAQGDGTPQKATETLAAKLKQDPSNAANWVLYGRSLATLRQWDQAEDAYRHAIDLGETGPDVAGDHAEIMVMQAGGTVTPAAATAFQHVLSDDPSSGIARYYLAVAAMQAGEPKKAMAGFQSLLAQLPAGSPLRSQLAQKVAEAAQAAGVPVPPLEQGPPQAQAAGPDAKAVADAANMSPEQREAMVRAMVATLAAKQQADPANLEGWLRLGRAYAVLHETDRAADAYDAATKLRPGDPAIPLEEARALLSGQAPADKLPPRVIELLKRIEAANPDQPLALWHLGLAAAQDGRPEEARREWGRLLAQLPPNDEDARMIRSAMDALPGKNPP